MNSTLEPFGSVGSDQQDFTPTNSIITSGTDTVIDIPAVVDVAFETVAVVNPTMEDTPAQAQAIANHRSGTFTEFYAPAEQQVVLEGGKTVKYDNSSTRPPVLNGSVSELFKSAVDVQYALMQIIPTTSFKSDTPQHELGREFSKICGKVGPEAITGWKFVEQMNTLDKPPSAVHCVLAQLGVLLPYPWTEEAATPYTSQDAAADKAVDCDADDEDLPTQRSGHLELQWFKRAEEDKERKPMSSARWGKFYRQPSGVTIPGDFAEAAMLWVIKADFDDDYAARLGPVATVEFQEFFTRYPNATHAYMIADMVNSNNILDTMNDVDAKYNNHFEITALPRDTWTKIPPVFGDIKEQIIKDPVVALHQKQMRDNAAQLPLDKDVVVEGMDGDFYVIHVSMQNEERVRTVKRKLSKAEFLSNRESLRQDPRDINTLAQTLETENQNTASAATQPRTEPVETACTTIKESTTIPLSPLSQDAAGKQPLGTSVYTENNGLLTRQLTEEEEQVRDSKIKTLSNELCLIFADAMDSDDIVHIERYKTALRNMKQELPNELEVHARFECMLQQIMK